ncbi:MAG: nucleoside 2-deoxyribosyltransferase [Candidatus Daviesbacteria bacterium]|nr:nucleoside 2-deoxyribosyltransferase [Candidatus Daviesbacteria bacterium]
MDKKKAFLGAPFADYVNPQTGRLYDDKQLILTRLISYLEQKGYVVKNSHVREDWGNAWMPPEICTPLDYQQIKEADIFVAIPGNPPSGGVHIELGWASALDTRVIILLEDGKKYSNLVLGLDKVGRVDYVHYKTLDECFEKLNNVL